MQQDAVKCSTLCIIQHVLSFQQCVYKGLQQQYLPICIQHAITMFSNMNTKMGDNSIQQ